MVYLFQHFLWKSYSANRPPCPFKSTIIIRRIKRFIIRLQKPEIGTVHVDRAFDVCRHICTKHYPVLMLNKKLPCTVRLSPQFINPCGKINKHIGKLSEQFGYVPDIFSIVRKMRQDKGCIWVLPDQIIPSFDQFNLAGIFWVREAPGWIFLQRFIMFVFRCNRFKKASRIRSG